MIHEEPSREPETGKRVYSVTTLTSQIKALLEDHLSFVWVTGEVSNLRKPVSGHVYFTLKDDSAQISAVLFRMQASRLAFDLEDGMSVTGMGRVSVYAPRGNYQIIFEYMEPKGAGALQAAFEQLKKKLFDEGLFDETHKRPTPFLPRSITVITSPTGAVIHDIMDIVFRRFPNMHIRIIPVRVQGEEAVSQIVDAFDLLNRHGRSDTAIIARGGGSLEDLSAFNSEATARAVFGCNIPVISAIGHETDYTITDFTADFRAPTPSAAAELVVPVKRDLETHLLDMKTALLRAFTRYLEKQRDRLETVSSRLVHPGRRLEDVRLLLDDYTFRMIQGFTRLVVEKRRELTWWEERIFTGRFPRKISENREKLHQLRNALEAAMNNRIRNNNMLLKESAARLAAMDPSAVLRRGYSVTRTFPEGRILKDSDAVDIGTRVETVLRNGTILSRVEEKRQCDD